MNEQEIAAVWTTLEPGTWQRRRIEARVFDWVEAHDTSLAAEWLAFFKVEPLAAAGLLAAGAAALITAPPLVWVLRSIV